MRLLVLLLLLVQQTDAANRPNILWITAEDMSPTLGCYGDRYAITPHIDRLATQSVRYTHAFATAPVCSPSRSCLITGCYAQSLGTHQMRSAFPIPKQMRGFPALLRKAGYFTSNNVKTDYNTANWRQIVRASWNENSDKAHWRNRKDKSTPFFCVFNIMTSHQSRSMVWPEEQFKKEVQNKLKPQRIHDPKKAPVPPYYPDTPLIRRTIARYYDCVTAMDQRVGEILKQLEEDGLAEDTIVFFYSDHGSGLPRHKRALLDSGMRVPLLVRFPTKYQEHAPTKAGETTDRLVSFVDFAPTVLSLAGVGIPKEMQGRPFLGKRNAKAREYVFGHRDRVDEVMDLARSVRDKRYLYIRNYMPHLGYNQQSAWPDQGAIRHELYRLTDEKKMTAPQWHFAGPTRAAEELYDCVRDPLNLRNLANSAAHTTVLARMREVHRKQIREVRDLGFLPEIEQWKLCEKSTPWQAARKRDLELDSVFKAAEAVGGTVELDSLKNLGSKNAAIRYWAATGLAAREKVSAGAMIRLGNALSDESPSVRIAAAEALIKHRTTILAIPTLIKELQHQDLTVVMYAVRAIELSRTDSRRAVFAMEQAAERARKVRPANTPATVVQAGAADLAMFIGFAVEGFLSRQKWISLFDGKTLTGWQARAKGEVRVTNREIQMLAKGSNLWLVHQSEFEDFELIVEAKMPSDAYNSGIGFRCAGKSGKPKGYQCEIDRGKSGMIYAIGSGWVWPKGKEQTTAFRKMSAGAFKNDQWNTFRIHCRGERIQIWINGIKTADVRDQRFRKGSIALQHHGKGGVHRFRNIRLRKL